MRRFKSRFRHYLNLAQMHTRLEQLLRDFRWDRMDRIFLTEPPVIDTVGRLAAR